MQVINLDQIKTVLDKPAIIDAVRQGLISHDRGDITSPMPMALLFKSDEHTITGDCHVKAASSDRYPYFCVKVATGFYNNPERGLDANNGLVMLLSAETGEPLVLFLDEGYLTEARTAAAGALAASLAAGNSPKRLGVIGTGAQAELQSRWISSHIEVSEITVFGRSVDKADALAQRIKDIGVVVRVAETTTGLSEQSDIIVTTTTATAPVLMSSDIRPGHHIVAMGTDCLGKNEIDSNILARADVIVTDDHDQCLDHSEFGLAVRAGLINEKQDFSLGALLADPTKSGIRPDSVSIVDLTGLGAQDLAAASLIYERLHANGTIVK